ncbi:MAG: bifunctional nuclease domain-containing protein [Bacteroidota bacterium]
MEPIQVDILGLSTSSSSGGAYALVLGETEGSRRLPIIIGSFEAQAIALELEKIQPPRPMTHDLLRDLLDLVGGDVHRVLVSELRDGTFYAKVFFTVAGNLLELDSRPSDAVALAVRVDAPIFVSAEVMEEAGIPGEDEPHEAEVQSAEEAPAKRAPRRPRSRLQHMEEQLEKAISEENYERAAQLRDEIEQLKARNG